MRAAAVVGVDVVDASAFERGSIEILVQRQLQRSAAFKKGVGDRMRHAAHRGDVDRAFAAMPFGRSARMGFEPAEIGKHVVIAPARIAGGFPVVEIVARAAHVDHRVDRSGAALDLAARHVDAAILKRGFRLARIHPVHLRVIVAAGVADRDLEPEGIVVAAGLDQKHLVATVLAEPARKDATRRPGADDDVIVDHLVSLISEFTRARGQRPSRPPADCPSAGAGAPRRRAYAFPRHPC
ncbi:hypothetical protein D9M70_439920 [compost metagenome]